MEAPLSLSLSRKGRGDLALLIFFEILILQHAERAEEDMVRESWLQSRGFRILRFWNSDVFTNMDGVLQTILKECTPLPQREREL